jgi:hypothetical protein
MRHVLALLAMFLAAPAFAYDDLVLPTVDFSATVMDETGGRQTRERIFYKDGKLRIERGQGFSVTILDLTTQTQCILMVNRTYLITPMDDELFRRFIARDLPASGARKQGVEQVAGMQATKYAFPEDGALKAAGFYWLTDTGIMVRRDYEEGVMGRSVRHKQVLTDLDIKPLPVELFGIPKGYRPAR